jgi:hypothetical protein
MTRQLTEDERACLKRNRHTYREIGGLCFPLSIGCEHCDTEKSTLVRVSTIRGQVCPVCDSELDAMYGSDRP